MKNNNKKEKMAIEEIFIFIIIILFILACINKANNDFITEYIESIFEKKEQIYVQENNIEKEGVWENW